MSQTRPNLRTRLNSVVRFVVFTFALCVSAPLNAQTTDLGTLADGDIVWTDGSVLQAAPDVPCEVCVSAALVLQADQDAQEAERLRALTGRLFLRLELTEEALDQAEKSRERAQAQARDVEGRPGFWSGAAFGATSTVVLVLVLVLAVQ